MKKDKVSNSDVADSDHEDDNYEDGSGNTKEKAKSNSEEEEKSVKSKNRHWLFPDLSDEERENMRQSLLEQEARYRRIGTQARMAMQQQYPQESKEDKSKK